MGEDIYFENKVREVLDIYSQIELDLLELIIKKLKLSNGEIGGSTEWLIKRLQELGGLNKETLKIISKYTKISQKELKIMFEKLGIDTIDSVNLAEAYRKGKIAINPSTFYQDKAIMTITKNAFDSTLKTFMEVNTNIVENVRRQYVEILNATYLETSTGVYDYGTSIRRALNKFADKGITVATYKYPDGTIRNYNIEGIVRRDLLTAMHQTSGKVMDEVVDITEPEYIKITEHYQARLTHEPWQGCIVRADEFDAITGNGEVDGIYGINCKHGHFPFFGEIDKRKHKTVVGYYGGTYKAYTQEVKVNAEENARLYELSQEQRYLERQVRRWKRREITAENHIGKNKAKKKINEYQTKLNKLVKNNPELTRNYLREKIPTKTPIIKTLSNKDIEINAKKYYNGNIDLYKKALNEQQKILDGKVPLDYKKEKYYEHVKGTFEYERNLQKGIKKSYLTISYEKAQELVKQNAGKGTIIFDNKGMYANREKIKFDSSIGYYISDKSNKTVKTQWGIIVYSKGGTHIYPIKGD